MVNLIVNSMGFAFLEAVVDNDKKNSKLITVKLQKIEISHRTSFSAQDSGPGPTWRVRISDRFNWTERVSRHSGPGCSDLKFEVYATLWQCRAILGMFEYKPIKSDQKAQTEP